MEIPALFLPALAAGAAVGLVVVLVRGRGKPEPPSIRLAPAQRAAIPVSYTHLTLPTIPLV